MAFVAAVRADLSKTAAIRQRIGGNIISGKVPNHPPCPKCGGTDTQPEPTGGYLCRQCDLGLPQRKERPMEATATPSTNGYGVIKLGRKGVRKFQYDDGYPEVELDVIVVQSNWIAIDRTFRDEKGDVPPERNQEWSLALHQFACEMLQTDKLSMADALHFLKLFNDEAEELKPFFSPRSATKPDSPGSTELRFSMED